MAILDLIPHLFQTGGGASTLDLAAENGVKGFLRAHPWLGIAGLAVALFAVAAAKPAGGEMVSRRVHALLFGGLGVIMLVFAVYLAVHGSSR